MVKYESKLEQPHQVRMPAVVCTATGRAADSLENDWSAPLILEATALANIASCNSHVEAKISRPVLCFHRRSLKRASTTEVN